jgi:hypothetical protein
LHKSELVEVLRTLEYGMSDPDDSDTGVDSELVRVSGTSEPEPFTTHSACKGAEIEVADGN